MKQRPQGHVSRRRFVQSAAATTAAIAAIPRFAVGAQPDRPLKVGVIGCGGRGKGAARNAMDAAPNVTVTALADIARDRLDDCNRFIGGSVDDKHCFVGHDAYKKLLDTDVDYVIEATPPYYRPAHFEAAIAAGKHVFMEKPVGVDPVGVRRIMAAGREARSKNLSVVAGTQRRHQNQYIETIRRIHHGAIGSIVAAQCYWNQSWLWHRDRQSGWSDEEWMHRDWVNWAWLSGDHIVEQHVHNLDVINWVIGRPPVKVVAMGGRARRPTGNQFDFFSADFTYPNEVHVHSMCRQINGCANNVSERVVGQNGYSNCAGMLSNFGRVPFEGNDPYVQCHADLIRAIRTDRPINEAQDVAESTMTAVMARTSAYTGREVTWNEMMESSEELRPPTYELTEENIRADVPVPGHPA